MEFVKTFEELGKNDSTVAGGKGASLGEMTRAGIPVPPGFVIVAASFDEFLKSTDLGVEIDSILHQVDHKEIHMVENASEKIKALILGAEMSENIAKEIQKFFKTLGAKYVAVRSSATSEDSADAAWAGQLESYLNTTEAMLLANVKKCWASLFTPRAIFYRFEKGLHGNPVSVAVVVQKMVESEFSGIAFSVHPVTQDYNQLIIEAGFGLGEAIVSGQITPDSYVVEKEPRRIMDININTQTRALYRAKKDGNKWRNISEPQASSQVLAEKNILELSDTILRIENHYGFPCDIEWAYEKGRFYIVQSRPITTLLNRERKEIGLKFEKSITRDWGIVYAEIWHKVFVEEFRKQIGWGYTEVVFEGEDNTITVYRAPKEHIDGMRDFILSQIDRERSWLEKQASKVSEKVEETIVWVEKVEKKKLEEYSHKNLAHIFDKFIKKNLELGPSFIMMLWFPIQMEQSEKLSHYKTAVDVAIETRARIEKIGPLVDSFARKIGTEVARRANISQALSRFISIGEIESYLYRNVLPENETLLRRQNYFIVTNDGILSENVRDYLQRCDYSLRKTDISNVSMIKGNTAYPGVVLGVVKIIRHKGEFNKFNGGEILVTGMTTPDFLPVVKKSIGFITDEGGITCHAAIVARELKKPCIIGTKSATQALKDGDLVEVDAEKGVVKILEVSHSNKEDYNPDDYVRMFAGKSFTYLLTDIFLHYYNTLGVLSIQDKDSWISFLPKVIQKKTLEEGKELYALKKKYTNYKKEFREYIRLSTQFFQTTLKKNTVSEDEAKQFFELISKHFSFYSKTEFFYTDLLNQNKIAPSIPEFEKLKLNGRSHLNKMVFEESGYIRSLLKKIFIQTGVSEEDLLNYSIDEILDLLKNGKHVKKIDIEKRYSFFSSKKFTVFGTEAKALIDKFFSAYRGISDIMTGTVANKGRTRGKARVLVPDFRNFDKITEDVQKMKKGEILVAETTSPEIIQACKKASAIITNQGGMLSHAAIVYREFRIPCIVGMNKDVILNIKTGDEIEVDADQGMVKFFKK